MADQVTASYRVLMIAPTSFFADYGCHVRIRSKLKHFSGSAAQLRSLTYHNGGEVAGLDVRRTLPIPGRSSFEVGTEPA